MRKLLLAPLFIASAASAQPDFAVKYNLLMNSTDQGYLKADGQDDPSQLNTLAMKSYLEMNGENKGVSYSIAVNLMAGNFSDAVEMALVTKSFGDLSLSVGKGYVNSGGYDNYNAYYDINIYNQNTNNHIFNWGVADLAQVDYTMGNHTLTVQVANDVVAATGDGTNPCSDSARVCGRYNTENKQPAVLLQYKGEFSGLTPLVQIVSSDSGHSMETVLGLEYEIAKFSGHFDYVMHSIGYKVSNTEYTDKVSAMSLLVRYDLGTMQPWLKYLAYDVKQDGTDLTGNSDRSSLDDNHAGFQLGMDFPQGENFIPYVELAQQSQTVTEAGNDESLTESTIVVGVKGSL